MRNLTGLSWRVHEIIHERRATLVGGELIAAAALPIAFLLLAAGLFGALTTTTFGFPLDDSWIHQVVGSNLAIYGVPSFSLDGQTSGSTSAFWPFVIALNHVALPAVPPALYLFVVNFLLLALITGVLFRAAVDDGLGRIEVSAIAGAGVMSGNFVWLTIAGMEHIAFVALVLLGTSLSLFRPASDSVPRTVLGGTCIGLATAARIEAVAFIPVFVLAFMLSRRSSRTILLFLAPVLTGVAVVLTYNLCTSDALMPTTFSGRKWLAFRSDYVPLSASLNFMSGYLPAVLSAHYADEGLVGFLIMVMSAAFGVYVSVRDKRWRLLVIGFLSLYLFVIYAVLMPTFGHAMRYVALPLLCTAVFVTFGFSELVRALGRPTKISSSLLGVVALLLCSIVSVQSLRYWTEIGHSGITHIDSTHARMGRWIGRHLPPDAIVASFDIGAIAWFSQRNVIDLGGLTDPDFPPYLFSGRTAEYLRKRRVEWLVLPSEHIHFERASDCVDSLARELRLCDSRALTKEPVVLFASLDPSWELAHKRTGHAMRAQKLYRLHWLD